MMLTILSVAYALAPVHPATAGGAEQVLGQIDSALVEAGHRSIVVACKGSSVSGTLVESADLSGALDGGTRRLANEQHRRAVARARDKWPIDLVHMHGLDFETFLPGPGSPALITLHLPPGWYRKEIFRLDRKRTYLHCVSRSQERACPPGANLLPVIENGVPVHRFPFSREKGKYVLCLGRICPEKGFHLALDAAAMAGVPLFLAGEVFGYGEHERYFQEEMVPRLNRGNNMFLGPLDFEKKSRLLASAKCLLAPSLAAETSSLAAMEALACGTPVVAFPSGAIPEIVEDGKTGFLVRDVREMAEAIAKTSRIDPAECRRAAEDRFSSGRMIKDYFHLYELAKNGELDSLLRK